MIKKTALAGCAVLALAACELDVPSLNNPSAGGDATRSSVIATAQGLIGNVRAMSTGLVINFGIWGRELYSLNQEEPRPTQDNLVGPRDRNSSGSGAGFNYGTIVEVREMLAALDNVENMTEQEKEGIRGFGKTVAGIAWAQTALVYPEFGAPGGAPADATGELVPVASGAELVQLAVQNFDEGYQHLQNAGASFPFGLTEGYSGFNTPATFARVNRALKARTLKYAGDWQGVLAALEQSFVDASADLDLGVYNNYYAADNAFNPYFGNANQYVHPRILADAQLKADGSKDDRAVEKTTSIDPTTVLSITVSERQNIFRDNVAPFPLITNEELLLIRAEARLATGDVAGALEDVNTVRTGAGGLEPVAGLAGNELRDEILYNKLYSLLWRGGWHYWDMKQYGLLMDLPRALPNHVVFDRVNWAAQECIQRSMDDGPCGPVDGF